MVKKVGPRFRFRFGFLFFLAVNFIHTIISSSQGISEAIFYSNSDMLLKSKGLAGEVFTILLTSPHLIIPPQHAIVHMFALVSSNWPWGSYNFHVQ